VYHLGICAFLQVIISRGIYGKIQNPGNGAMNIWQNAIIKGVLSNDQANRNHQPERPLGSAYKILAPTG
jgi:hypothetical protein